MSEFLPPFLILSGVCLLTGAVGTLLVLYLRRYWMRGPGRHRPY